MEKKYWYYRGQKEESGFDSNILYASVKFSNNNNQRKSEKYNENEKTYNSKLLSFSNKSANGIERQNVQWLRVLPVTQMT